VRCKQLTAATRRRRAAHHPTSHESKRFQGDDGGEITDLLCTTFPFVKGFEKMGALRLFQLFEENPVALIFDHFSVSHCLSVSVFTFFKFEVLSASTF
jgi:hypothetical protein